jgi:hypothetical protein
VFENQRGAIGFRITENVVGSVTIDAPDLTQDLGAIRQALVTRLTGLGLYPKEARAMVETWADSWFTEGSRRGEKAFVLSPAAQTYLRAIAAGHSITGNGYGNARETVRSVILRGVIGGWR